MLNEDAQDDLRLSIGAKTKQMPPPFSQRQNSNSQDDLPGSELLNQLQQSRIEYDSLKQHKEQMERTKLEQQLETTIEMKETIEILQEESLVKHQQLDKYESKVREQSQEVSQFFTFLTFLSLGHVLQGPKLGAHEPS